MAYEVIWTEKARSHYQEIVNYLLGRWNKTIAEEFINAVEKKLNLLSHFPNLGKASEKNTEVRQILINKYHTVYYSIQSNLIFVLALHDNRQNPENINKTSELYENSNWRRPRRVSI